MPSTPPVPRPVEGARASDPIKWVSGDAVAVNGDLDLATVQAWQSRAFAIIDRAEGTDLRLDLSDLTFIDITGLTLLLRIRRHCLTRQLRLVLSEPSPRLTRLLATARMSDQFDIEPVQLRDGP